MASASTSSSTPPEYSRAPPKMKTINEEPSSADCDPIRPPGLLPLPGARLWRPHEDQYWTQLREQWNIEDIDSATDEQEVEIVSKRPSPPADRHVRYQQDQSQNGHGSEDEMHDIDLCTANGTVFRIVLGNGEQHGTERDSGGHPGHNTVDVQRRGSQRHINHTPLTDAVSLHLPPPPAVHKQPKRKHFKGSALNVSVTTSTRTYGDFSKMNPPPYTPRPTNAERSFGRNGKLSSDEDNNKWPVAKWLFIFGFVLPLLWLFGSFLLFSGLRKLSAEPQTESQDSTPSSKFDTRSGDTNSSLHTNNITRLIAQEVLWSKRCAVAFVLFAVACFIALGVLKAVGM